MAPHPLNRRRIRHRTRTRRRHQSTQHITIRIIERQTSQRSRRTRLSVAIDGQSVERRARIRRVKHIIRRRRRNRHHILTRLADLRIHHIRRRTRQNRLCVTRDREV